ncbi:hypothetical protein AC629_39305 [Bradyrhizobium sp. NAS80.1]|uniref:hypothetical protein n=1 Tax=Bradyrhizobium sp. NAS80.1 TaxID=1680159 RepID=UPI000965F049|nr:hypothetical protein [Bradyrhizobium sp. NAS80.1]OKO71388.1 hypothetical protein AC629_39305 [Bradyrhizobium sp. NAS80.1]
MLWMIKFGITAVVAIAALRLGANYDLHTVVTTTDSQNHAVAAKYLNGSTHNTVLVGSSLTFRLFENYFRSDDVENLSLAGGSPATGLAIVAGAATPKLVLVETNILNRVLDESFITRLNDRSSSAFQPVRSAAAYYETLMHPPLKKEQVRSVVDRLIAQPPSDVVDSDLVQFAIKDAAALPPIDAVRRGLSDIRKYKALLESRGVKVLLFHMPYSLQYEATPYATFSTQMASEAFPNPDSWLPINVDPSQLRWTDGVHLDERSAAMVARAIEKSIENSVPGGFPRTAR